MEGYNRMSLDVTRLLSLIQENPPLWDPVSEDFKNRQVTGEIWVKICRTMYEQWDGLEEKMQKKLMQDVRNRWRTCKDQFRKYSNEAEKSGSAAPKRKVAHFEQLQFLKTSRVVRQSSGNIPNRNPNENDNDSQQSTESTADPENNQDEVARPSGISAELAGRRASNDGTNQQATISRRGARTASLGRGRAISVESEAIAMLQRVDAEDHVSYTMAERLRKLPEDRQWSCVPAVFELMSLYASPHPIPDNAEIINAIVNLREKYCIQTHENRQHVTRPAERYVGHEPAQTSNTYPTSNPTTLTTQPNEQYENNASSYLGFLYSSDDPEYLRPHVRNPNPNSTMGNSRQSSGRLEPKYHEM